MSDSKSKNKNVLMCAMNYYTGPFRVGSHHYAYSFKKLGYDVAYISKPLSPWHLLFAKNAERTDRFDIWRNQGVVKDDIWSYVPMSSFTPSNTPLLRSQWCFDHWQNFTFPNFINVLKERGFDRVNILWFDNPVFGFLLDQVPHEKSVLRIADNLKGFENSWPALIEKETELAGRVDRVIYTARNLKGEFEGKVDEGKMTYVSNGVDFDFFEKADKSFPEEFSKIPEPRITYVGAIDKWFDIEMLVQTAKNLPGCNFVVIGLARTNISRLEGVKNIFLLGSKPYSRVPQFLTHSQVGIIPFVRNDLVKFVNPIKLFEYMACGLPVVSTSWEELRQMNSPAFLAENEAEFTAAVKKALDEPKNKAEYIEYARGNEWQARLRQVLELLK
jgi:glycosyltransferase involved in cell wall biosynthesis